ncbi:homoserine O-succinyltransferase [Aquimonas sp.]|jgi:homoserine O-acetyltransferase|uniref:homoserine O-succinyltransferase MetX n=1 Tax=Aquimonas sp. TaxID=1872588 RepID=UPI0037BE6BF0
MSLATVTEARAEAHSEPDCSGFEHLPGLPTGGRDTFEFELDLRHAGPRRVQLRVEWVGSPKLPAVWVAGGISAHRHACANTLDTSIGWWQELIGAGQSLDPSKFCLLACDWVGADGDLDLPISSADQADAIAQAVELLGIRRLHAFVGASYGGMVGQAFAVRHPQRIERLVCLSAAHRPHPFASAFRALQRQVVALGQLQCADDIGLSLARQFAMLSYRSPEEFGARFDAPAELSGGRARCASEGYLSRCGQSYAERWSATAFLRLSESIDLHAVEPAQIMVPTTLLAVEGDWLASPADIDSFAAGIAAPTEVECIASSFGHDAFLKEPTRINELLARALRSANVPAGVH